MLRMWIWCLLIYGFDRLTSQSREGQRYPVVESRRFCDLRDKRQKGRQRRKNEKEEKKAEEDSTKKKKKRIRYIEKMWLNATNIIIGASGDADLLAANLPL